MGSLLHIFEFNQGRMTKKVHAHSRHNGHNRHNGALKSPRNSVELHVETSQVHFPEGEPHYSSGAEDGWSKKNSHSYIPSVKELNNEKLSKQPITRNNAPSLVARLMGIDMMPLDTKPVVSSHERISENKEKFFSKKSSNFSSSSQKKFDSFHQEIEDDDGWENNFGKPRPREHPQEEELQKFKKEFEAFQAARFKECSKVVEIASVCSPILAQEEKLNKEKVQQNSSSQREATEKSSQLDSHLFETKLFNADIIVDPISIKRNESFPSRRKLIRDFEEFSMIKCGNRLDICSSPTQIVILKPGPDKTWNFNNKENCISSSNTLQGRNNSVESFLEEVRERLKCEIQGKTVKKGSVVRASGIETPYGEKPSDPTVINITHHMDKGVRQNVTRDAEANFLRSESTRSYNSDIIYFNGSSSPEEFLHMDTRRFLSERLRNIVNSEVNNWKTLKEKIEIQRGSFRHEPDDYKFDISPRNLVRSLSAPVSGASFGKLLLDDHHILTGAHIQRRLEAVEAMPIGVKNKKKDRFNIKEKVSNFKHILSLRGKLFGKRVQSVVKESNGNEYDSMVRDIRSGPTVLMKYENSTEVPPSPASVCSFAQEEYWRQIEFLSPISTTPDVSSIDDFVPKTFRDISSGLNELRRQLSQLDTNDPEDFTMKQKHVDSELLQLDDPAESYIRDLLIASGLYFGSWDKSLLRRGTFAKPIGNSVFEEVEESHKKLANNKNERSKLNNKVLLDLLNEALSIVLEPPLTLSRFRKKLSNYSSMQPPLCGKELLKLVWEIISVSLNFSSKSSPFSLDSLVAQDLGSISWFEVINDQVNVFEREITCLITDDLVEEFTKDMICS